MAIGRASDYDYLALAKRLMPPGALREAMLRPGRILHALWLGAGAEFARMHNRLHDALTEIDPRTASETLGAWEQMAGLPDAQFPLTSDAEARRAAILAKFSATRGTSMGVMRAIAEALGAFVVFRAPYYPYTYVGCKMGARLEHHEAVCAIEVRGTCATDRRAALEAAYDKYAPADAYLVFSYITFTGE